MEENLVKRNILMNTLKIKWSFVIQVGLFHCIRFAIVYKSKYLWKLPIYGSLLFLLLDVSQPETTIQDGKEESRGEESMGVSTKDDVKNETIKPMNPSIKGAACFFK